MSAARANTGAGGDRSAGDERLRILRMVEDGKITAADAAMLIKALGADAQRRVRRAETDEGRLVRVLVTDTDSGRARVNLRVPARLVDLALGFGAKFGADSIAELDQVADAMHAGAVGKVVETVDDDGRHRIEVFIE